ncbi:MAG: septum formation initiator family protein, partial [Treponema sp.]|nr:septum formation initiator family protein [Treponema sp.]
AAAARKLDYIVPREKLVKITGLRVAETKIYDTGSVLRRTESTFLPDSVCKATGCIIFLGTVLLFLVLSLPDRNPRSGR